MEKRQPVSDSELELMRIIWSEGGSALFARIMDALEEQGRDWKTNTVLTFLARLTEKGMLSVEKQGRLNRYIALVPESDYMDQQTKTFLERIYHGNARGLVSSLLKQDCLSGEDFEELKAFWEENSKGN